MTTPERVAELLQEDAALTDNERQALAELFAAAYEQLTADGRPLTAFLFDNDDPVWIRFRRRQPVPLFVISDACLLFRRRHGYHRTKIQRDRS
jgi:hypothetical protein